MLNNLCLRSEIKPSKSKPFQKCCKVEILGRARQEEQLSQSKLKKALIQMSNLSYLIQCIRCGSRKVQSECIVLKVQVIGFLDGKIVLYTLPPHFGSWQGTDRFSEVLVN